MTWSNWHTKTFNMHHRDEVLETVREYWYFGTGEYEDVEDIIRSIMRDISNKVEELAGESGDYFIFDVIEDSLEQVNVKELAETYYSEVMKDEKIK